ncbi:MAG TPA: hypothetical protein VGN98_08745, partial [Tianweitania sediminis]|nr:hypothetical protein [Tianweitania sediminis]
MKKIFALALCATALTTSSVYADPGKGKGDGGKTYVLANGDTYSTPGQMFQALRDREDGASGNPK